MKGIFQNDIASNSFQEFYLIDQSGILLSLLFDFLILQLSLLI